VIGHPGLVARVAETSSSIWVGSREQRRGAVLGSLLRQEVAGVDAPIPHVVGSRRAAAGGKLLVSSAQYRGGSAVMIRSGRSNGGARKYQVGEPELLAAWILA
jgi:hypothetical protein